VTVLWLDDGTTAELGTVLAKAGEGSIYEVIGRADFVAKVFHTTLSGLSEKLDKVAAMVETPPPGVVQSDGFVVLTWPQHLVFESGRPVGYLMPRVDTKTAVEIHTVSNPFNRANPLKGAPQWTVNATWAHLVSVAANLCLAVDAVHRVDAVIGDFQERNVLVSNTSRVTLVDCDSMQFTASGGRQFLCGVARPEFAAPELAEANLRLQPRNASSDLFALAIHIYQLLMGGNHPFMRGVWTGQGDQPVALRLAQAGWWAGGPASQLATHPLAPPISFLPADVIRLFERAFTDGSRDPALRPSAAEWRRELQAIRTTTCLSGTHQIPVFNFACPWCVIESERAQRKRNVALSRPGGVDPQAISHIADMGPVIPWPDPAPPSAAGWGRGTGAAPVAPSSPASNRRMRIAVSLSVVGAIAIIAIGVVIGAISTRSGDQTAGSGSVATTPPSESATADPDTTAQAINNAQPGDCIHRENGPVQIDGSFTQTVSIVMCGSSDATDKVAARTNDATDCGTSSSIRTDEYLPPIVLCLDRP
jgi:eukaryotic-like serine/threonine-protein kinase